MAKKAVWKVDTFVQWMSYHKQVHMVVQIGLFVNYNYKSIYLEPQTGTPKNFSNRIDGFVATIMIRGRG